jgi:hypothetical protein
VSLLPSATSTAIWSQRYEALRNHALEGQGQLGAMPRSLALLRGRGLAGWIRGWQEMTAPRPVPTLVASEPQLPLTPSWQQQLTVLLAQMTAQQLAST